MAGFMHWWGLTIDVVSCIDLVLAVGLCVDYAAHIGHAFMCCEGESRAARAQRSLQQIGPAVFSGGFSTFLAFVLLASSDSHVFLTYFKASYFIFYRADVFTQQKILHVADLLFSRGIWTLPWSRFTAGSAEFGWTNSLPIAYKSRSAKIS